MIACMTGQAELVQRAGPDHILFEWFGQLLGRLFPGRIAREHRADPLCRASPAAAHLRERLGALDRSSRARVRFTSCERGQSTQVRALSSA